ncbi:hypothetical protein NE235_33155 [Actinoallomurus spadix]|uniref:Serine/threonine protein kinase n=1 Tax=Actinoallomurus spadix TaxID=79912 RepID=A0ABP3GHZ9_9ACTN|nr:hypothetical protein [Actinoallomurus spadix]MCO5990971.1 hypothetical protein [Actinoallomurus spadix]
MPKPLQVGDPAELGPFRLRSRLRESIAGIVYLGADADDRPVTVALLTAAAAGDAAARDRFRAAIARETPPQDPVPRVLPEPGPGEPAPVIAALTEGGAPWVATTFEEGRAGAERFLEPVLPQRGWTGRVRRGPQFQAHWVSGPAGPAVSAEGPPVSGPVAAFGDSKGLAAAVLSLAALLALLVLLVFLLFSCEPTQPAPPIPTETPTSTPVSPEPSPSLTSPRPSPSPGRSTPGSPRPSPSGGQDSGDPGGPLSGVPGGRLR